MISLSFDPDKYWSINMFLNTDEKLRIKIQRMQHPDLEAVLKIENSFPHPWSRTHFEQSLKFHNECFVLILQDTKEIVGYFIGTPGEGEYNVHNIVIDAKHHRKGFATAMFRLVVKNHFKKFQNYFLEVRKGNTSAIELYYKLGFKVISIRKDYYSNPTEDAFVMKFSLLDNIALND